jgi:hypothetical protein
MFHKYIWNRLSTAYKLRFWCTLMDLERLAGTVVALNPAGLVGPSCSMLGWLVWLNYFRTIPGSGTKQFKLLPRPPPHIGHPAVHNCGDFGNVLVEYEYVPFLATCRCLCSGFHCVPIASSHGYYCENTFSLSIQQTCVPMERLLCSQSTGMETLWNTISL